MKRESEFVGNFAISVLLLAGSFAVAQSATAAKKVGSATTMAAVSGSSGQGDPAPQTTQAAAVTPATTQNQPSATTTKPKRMVSADKRTIPVPQL